MHARMHTPTTCFYVIWMIWSFFSNYMKQSHLRRSAMQWWSSETVSCSPSLQLDVMTGYIMGINKACGHITQHTNSWWKRQRQSLKCWTGWLLKTSLNLFLDGSSRHMYYIYLLLFGNKHWTSVFFLMQAICIKLQWNLFTVNILFNYILLQSKYEEEG